MITSCRRALLALSLLAAGLPVAAQPVPLHEFFGTALMAEPLLSPDGKRLAVVVANEKTGRRQLGVIELDNGLKSHLAAGIVDGDVRQVQWVNDRRLVFALTDLQASYDEQFAPGLYAVNHDGSEPRLLILRRWLGVVSGEAARPRELTPNHQLLALLRDGSADVIIRRFNYDSRWRDLVDTTPMRLNTQSGQAVPLLVGYPRGARAWLVDETAQPRMLTTLVDGQTQIHWRAGPEAPWAQIASFDAYRGGAGFDPVAMGPDGEIYATAVRSGAGGGTRELFRFDREKLKLDPAPLVSIAGFDYDGRLIFDHRQRKLLGVRFTGDATATAWLDDGMKKLQARIDQRLPGLVNLIEVPECNCGRWLVVTAYSDRQPPIYLLYDREADQLQMLGRAHPGIDPRRMAQRDFARFKARDGLSVPVHTTRPAGKGPWPAVVLVHGGPWVRGGSWRWTAESQFLASRGYLVIEPEFRGSEGYGHAHFQAGWKQWGLKMQDDVADAARWAIEQKLADPQRICIAGASYGGYATLMGLIRDPDLYRCGVAWVAVSDIQMMYDLHWSDFSDEWKGHGMPALVGDPVKDAEQLVATSPLKQAQRLKQPLLLAHGGQDRRVPIEHGTRLRDALRKSNDQLEWVEYPDEGHGWFKPENRYDFYGRMERFLARHLQPK